jgi:hypothetical protein
MLYSWTGHPQGTLVKSVLLADPIESNESTDDDYQTSPGFTNLFTPVADGPTPPG